MPGRGPKSKGQQAETRTPDTAERKRRESGAEAMDLPVADPNPEAQGDGDPGPDKKMAGC